MQGWSKLYNNALAWFLYKGNEPPCYLVDSEIPRSTIDIIHKKRKVSIDSEDYALFVKRNLSWDVILDTYTAHNKEQK